jgi:hypothetical protein
MPQESNVLIVFVNWLVKWLAIFVGGLVALGLSLVGGWWTWNWWTYERPKGQIHVAAINSAAPQADTRVRPANIEKCFGTEFPVLVAYFNESPRTIEYIDIEVKARLPGRSTNILMYDARATSDQIIEPRTGFVQCYRFSVRDEYKSDPDVAKAIYSANPAFPAVPCRRATRRSRVPGSAARSPK